MKTEDKKQDPFCVGLDRILKNMGKGVEEALALQTGLSQSGINRIRNGHSHGTFKNRTTLANALETSVQDIIVTGGLIIDGHNLDPDSDILKEKPRPPDTKPAAHSAMVALEEMNQFLKEELARYRTREDELKAEIARLKEKTDSDCDRTVPAKCQPVETAGDSPAGSPAAVNE